MYLISMRISIYLSTNIFSLSVMGTPPSLISTEYNIDISNHKCSSFTTLWTHVFPKPVTLKVNTFKDKMY